MSESLLPDDALVAPTMSRISTAMTGNLDRHAQPRHGDLVHEPDGTAGWVLRRGASLDNGVYFGIDQVPEVAGRSDGGGASLWFNVDSLAEAFGACVVAGARVRYPPEMKPMGAELASLFDLDGNVFGLVQRSD